MGFTVGNLVGLVGCIVGHFEGVFPTILAEIGVVQQESKSATIIVVAQFKTFGTTNGSAIFNNYKNLFKMLEFVSDFFF